MGKFSAVLMWVLVLFGSHAGRAQDVRVPERSQDASAAFGLLGDSLKALERYNRLGQVAAVERLASGLLARYPGRVALMRPNEAKQPIDYVYGYEYPQRAYVRRGEVRQIRGDLRGAATDFDQAVRYGEAAYPKDRYPATDQRTFYNHPAVEVLREAYYARAALRREALRDPMGSCADLGRAFQLDTLRASNLRFRGCSLPAGRAPLDNSHATWASKHMQDSVARAQLLLDQKRPGPAEQVMRHLEAGQAGPYVRVLPPRNQLYYLHVQLARQRGNYRRAVAYLDTLLPDNYGGSPRDRYERGLLRLDHLNDRAGGCEDLRWVYDHDSTRTTPAHPRWRGCPLPARKIPVSNAELLAHKASFIDSVARATALCRAGQSAPGLRLFNQLLTTGEAGAYAPRLELNRVTGRFYPQLYVYDLAKVARSARSEAYEALGDYPQAVADLDTLIRDYDFASVKNKEWHCRRGAIMADHLNKREQACADLAECSRRGGTPPPSKNPWRDCYIREQTAAHRFNQTGVGQALFANLTEPSLRLGYFRQGGVRGGELGIQLSENADPLINYGPSLGLEMGGYTDNQKQQLLVAPKLSYEAEAILLGGRLDLAYYIGARNDKLVGDLRLTPQIGLSLLAVFNVFYGYAIPLAGPEIGPLGRHRFSLYINFLRISELSGKIGG